MNQSRHIPTSHHSSVDELQQINVVDKDSEMQDENSKSSTSGQPDNIQNKQQRGPNITSSSETVRKTISIKNEIISIKNENESLNSELMKLEGKNKDIRIANDKLILENDTLRKDNIKLECINETLIHTLLSETSEERFSTTEPVLIKLNKLFDEVVDIKAEISDKDSAAAEAEMSDKISDKDSAATEVEMSDDEKEVFHFL